MKRFFFLPSEIIYGLLILLIFSLVKLPFDQFLFVFALVTGVSYAFRRMNIPYRETLKPDGEVYLTPVNGTVESVRQNVPILNDSEIGHEIRISISIWDGKGLYLPTTGEVAYLKANKGKKIPRDAEAQDFYGHLEDVSHTDFVLSSKNQSKTQLRFVDAEYCLRPTIWLKSGDRGRGAACFGYYPFGGTLIIYLPRNSDVLVFESECVTPGQTVIAAIKDVK